MQATFRAIPAAVGALGIVEVARSGAEFSRSFAEVETIAQGTGEEIEGLRERVLDLSIELGRAPVEVNAALYQTLSAGFSDAAEASELLEQGLRLATAGLAGSAESIDGLTSVLNAYRLGVEEAGEVSDAFFRTVELGKTTIPELASSIGQVAPLASQLGVSYQELLAAVAALTQQGLSTSEAFTQVRSTLTGLLRNSEQIDAALSRVGSSFDTNAVRARGLADVLNDVRTAVGSNEAELVSLFGRVDAVGGVLGLTGANAEVFAATTDGVTNSVNATDEAFDKIASSSGERLRRAFSNIRTEAAALGKTLLDTSFETFDQLNAPDPARVREVNTLTQELLDGQRQVTQELRNQFGALSPVTEATRALREEAEAAGLSFGETARRLELL
ncbi:MAG: phage tail tape measure protein, partial [Planctomycetota bacterium]